MKLQQALQSLNLLTSGNTYTATLRSQTSIQYSVMHPPAASSASASLPVSFICFGCYFSRRKFSQQKSYESDACKPSDDCMCSLCSPVFFLPAGKIAIIDSISPCAQVAEISMHGRDKTGSTPVSDAPGTIPAPLPVHCGTKLQGSFVSVTVIAALVAAIVCGYPDQVEQSMWLLD